MELVLFSRLTKLLILNLLNLAAHFLRTKDVNGY